MAVLGLFLIPSAVAVEPQLDSSTVATGQFDYRTTLRVGDTRLDIDSERHIHIDDTTAARRLKIRTITRTDMGQTEDLLELDFESLMPIERKVRQGDGRMQINYGPERVTGYIQAAGQTVPVNLTLEKATYAGESGLEAVLTAMPLASGQSFELDLIEVDVDTRVRRFQISVGELESIHVPAGQFNAWPVHLRATDEFDDEQTLWISDTAPRVFVRAEAPVPVDLGGGSLMTVLMGTGD